MFIIYLTAVVSSDELIKYNTLLKINPFLPVTLYKKCLVEAQSHVSKSLYSSTSKLL